LFSINDKRHVIILFFLLLLIGCAFFLVGDQVLFSSDTSSLNYVLRRWFTNQIQNGHFPLWNPHLFGGIYQLASPVVGFFSPFTILYFFTDGIVTQQLCLLFLTIISGYSVFKLSFHLGKSKSASFLLGLIYPFLGITFSLQVNYPYFASLSILPLSLYYSQKFFNSFKIRDAIFFTLSWSWILIEGDPFTWAFSLILFFTIPNQISKKKIFLSLMAVTVVCLALTAVIWLPALDVLTDSRRAGGVSFQDATYFSLHPLELINFFIPHFWGSLHDHSFWGSHLLPDHFPFTKKFWFDSLYLPISLFSLIKYELLKKFCKKNKLFLIFSALMLLLSFGEHTPLYHLFFEIIPGWNTFRFPAKLFIYPFIFIIIINISTLSSSLKSKNILEWKRIFTKIAIFHFIIIIILLLRNLNLDRVLTDGVLSQIFLLILSLLFYLLIDKIKKFKISLFTPLSIFIIIDVFIHLPSVPKIDRNIFKQLEYRNHKNDSLFVNKKVLIDGLAKDTSSLNALPSNWSILKNTSYTFGYEPTIPKRYDKLTGSQLFLNLDQWLPILGIDSIISIKSKKEVTLKRMHSQGIISPRKVFEKDNLVYLEVINPTAKIFLTSNVSWIASSEESLRKIKERKTLLPIFFEGIKKNDNTLSLKNIIPLKNKRINNNSILIQIPKVSTGDGVVIRESFSKGWKAYQGKKRLKIYRADYFGMGIILDKNSSHKSIRLEFQPSSFYWGARISFLTFIILILGYFLFLLFGFRQTFIKIR